MHTIVLLTGFVLTAVPALPAAPPNAPVPAAPAVAAPTAAIETEGWYGAPAAVSDGVSISLILGGLAIPASSGAASLGAPLVTFGVLGFGFGGPITHVYNQHYGRAAASLALRALGTVIGGFVLVSHEIHGCDDDYHPTGCDDFSVAQLAALSLPFLAAAALDDFLFMTNTIPARSARAPSGPTLTPTVGRDWAALSLAGRF